MATDKVFITTDRGEHVGAAAPVIIPASRSTDIPAFYAKWFFNRLRRGYCAWYNPFNQQKICGCMVSKDIGMYNTCRHFCAYCYANTSRDCVLRNKSRHSDDSESLIE